MEIDLIQSVVGKDCIRDHWYKVGYEGLHVIYYRYGYYGHNNKDYKIENDKFDPKFSQAMPRV
jgi:hypothetical protein